MGVIQWLTDNASLISAFASVGTLIIWVLYLQLFYSSYRRAKQPNMLIHQSNFSLDGWCLIANMSESAVYIMAVLVDAEFHDQSYTWQPVDPRGLDTDVDRPFRYIKQGPLETGDYITLGTFRQLLHEAAYRVNGSDDIDLFGEELQLRVRVIVFVGAQLTPMGAERRFRIRMRDNDADVRPMNLFPTELSSRRKQRLARRWLEESERLPESEIIASPGIERGDGRGKRGS